MPPNDPIIMQGVIKVTSFNILSSCENENFIWAIFIQQPLEHHPYQKFDEILKFGKRKQFLKAVYVKKEDIFYGMSSQ